MIRLARILDYDIHQCRNACFLLSTNKNVPLSGITYQRLLQLDLIILEFCCAFYEHS